MVSFICNACGQTVKKVQVERHYLNECRSCDVLSCIDCGKDFHGDEYVSHTKCITEAEKYQGKLYKPKDKQNKGEQKQQEWLKNIKEATKSDTADPRLASLLERIGEYSNIPRKRAKFQNFCKNSINVRDSQTLDKLWDIFSESTKKDVQTGEDNSNGTVEHEKDKMSAQENGAETSRELEISANSKKQKKGKKSKDSDTSESEYKTKEKKKRKKMPDITEEENGHKKGKKRKRKRSDDNIEIEEESQSKASKVSLEENEKKENDAEDQENAKFKGHFNWKSVIKAVLREAPDQELPIKRLRKKVLAEFQAREANDRHLSENELRALFDKKVTKNPTFKVHKDRVKLVK